MPDQRQHTLFFSVILIKAPRMGLYSSECCRVFRIAWFITVLVIYWYLLL